jgi:hypothetical protein
MLIYHPKRIRKIIAAEMIKLKSTLKTVLPFDLENTMIQVNTTAKSVRNKEKLKSIIIWS